MPAQQSVRRDRLAFDHFPDWFRQEEKHRPGGLQKLQHLVVIGKAGDFPAAVEYEAWLEILVTADADFLASARR